MSFGKSDKGEAGKSLMCENILDRMGKNG